MPRAKTEPAKPSEPNLDAVELKRVLWDTLQGVRSGAVTAPTADAIAGQAREILRCVKTQLSIFHQANETVSKELVGFAKP